MTNNTVSIQCPQCGATFNINEDKDYCFCEYCGTRIQVNNGTKTYVHKEVDEARIKEAEITERLKLKQMENEKLKLENQNKLMHIWLVVMIVIFIVAIILDMFHNSTSSVLIIADICFFVRFIKTVNKN